MTNFTIENDTVKIQYKKTDKQRLKEYHGIDIKFESLFYLFTGSGHPNLDDIKHIEFIELDEEKNVQPIL